MPRVANHRRPWSLVRGPAAAFIASVRRLGWTTQSPGAITVRGGVYQLGGLGLWQLHGWVREATLQQLEQHWISQAGAQAAGIQRICMAPLRALMRRPVKKGWTMEHRSRVRAVFTGAAWPQQRLHEKGLADSPLCQACFASPGTDSHRHFFCCRRKEARDGAGHEQYIEEAKAAAPGDELLWGRGICQDPAIGMPVLPDGRVVKEVGNLPERVTGEVWTDGSFFFGKHRALRRAGWGFVCLDPQGAQLGGVCGPLPLPQEQQVILAGELWAVLEALRRAAPPLTIYTDCQLVVDGIGK